MATKKLIIYSICIMMTQWSLAQTDSLTMGLKGQIVRAFEQSANSPRTFYAGLKGNRLGTGLMYKSEDAGETWHALNAGQAIDPYVADIQAVAQSNAPDATLWAGTWKSGLFKSGDGGATWQKDVHFPSADIRSIRMGVQHPRLIYAATSAFGVVKSTDGGQQWQRPPAAMIDSTFSFAWNIELDPTNDQVIYAQTFGDGVWKSTDEGSHWHLSLDTEGKVCWDMHVGREAKNIWVATSKRGDTLSTVYHSVDHGATWQEIPDVPQVGVNQVNVVNRNGKNILFIGSWQGGVHRYEDERWTKEEEVDTDAIAHILVLENKVLVGSWGNGIYLIDVN